MSSRYLHCIVTFDKVTRHMYQLFAGLRMLEDQQAIKITYKQNKQRIFPNNMMSIEVDGYGSALYDVKDGYYEPASNDMESFDDIMDEYSFCFKRSFSREKNAGLRNGNKIHPLGFNYMVTCDGSRANRPLPHDTLNEKVKKILRYVPGTGRSLSSISYSAFEVPPRTDKDPNILFLTRVWDPPKGKHHSHYRELNEFRAECIRRCREEFGNYFTGGLEATELALNEYADAVVTSQAISRKDNYLAQMRESNICISTTGLYMSNGWKLAEYIAASKAIVSETLHYEVPGNFAEEKNYLKFTSVDECIEAIGRLVEDRYLRRSMQCANYAYYHQHMRPDRLILNSILRLISLSTNEFRVVAAE